MVKVLVADGTTLMRMIIKDILEKNGFEVVGEAINGDDAVDKYIELSPDLVTMEIAMPGSDGIDALKEIIRINPDAKVIMCSAMGQQAKVIESIETGAKDFIGKPFQADRVINSIKRLET